MISVLMSDDFNQKSIHAYVHIEYTVHQIHDNNADYRLHAQELFSVFVRAG